MSESHLRRSHLARRSRRARGTALVTGSVVLATFACFIVQLLRPAPGLEARTLVPAEIAIRVGEPPMTPVAGTETAVAVEGVGSLYSSDHETAIPIASVTKIMSALVILADHPPDRGGRAFDHRDPSRSDEL
jgi:D-alanyl-D-alanine carboxypeptidase